MSLQVARETKTLLQSGNCVQENCAILGVHPMFRVQLGSKTPQTTVPSCAAIRFPSSLITCVQVVSASCDPSAWPSLC